MCWGKYISGQSAIDFISADVTFPITFSYYPVAFSAVANDYSDICTIRNDTKTGFTMNIHERYNQYTVFANFWWICIGY